MPRIRADGGIIGSLNVPTTGLASGVWSLKEEERSSRNSTWPSEPPAVSTDPYFNLNMLLLHGENTNGTNNSVFVDGSTNAYTITRSGTGPQGTFSPFSQTGWSAYLGGSSALTIPYSSTNYAFHTTDFTVEAWIYPTSYTGMAHGASNIPTLIGGMVYNTTTADWAFGLDNSGILKFYYYNGSTISVNSTTTVPLNTWSHIAMTKTSSGISLFYNGSLVSGPTAVSGTPTVATTLLSMGAHNSTYISSCYVSNARIIKGTALYTGAYAVPTSPLTAVTNTTFLAFQSNRFKDNSSIAAAFTVVGTAAAIQPFSPFAPGSTYTSAAIGGSSYFNGSADYLTLPSNMTVLGTNAYTLEGWFYPTTVSAVEIPLVKLYNATQTVELRIVSSKIQGRINNSATIVGGNTTLYPNQWYHFALVKPTSGSSTAVLYINGVAESTTAVDNTTYTAFTTPRIGANQTPTLYFTGWASSVRVLNGTAQYSTNFTPPTAPFTNISNTLFLTNFTNAGIIDSTSKVDLATFGTAAVSSSQSKYGSTSISIPAATNSYCTINALELNDLRSGSWTVECWVYALGIATRTGFISKSNSAGTSVPFLLEINASGFLQGIAQDSVSQKVVTDASSFTANAWTHVALVRNVNTLTLYKNGVSVGTPQTLSGALVTTTDEVRIGVNKFQSTSAGCYIDDARISRYARYTANFTPSTTAFPDQ